MNTVSSGALSMSSAVTLATTGLNSFMDFGQLIRKRANWIVDKTTLEISDRCDLCKSKSFW